jgi:hypothetical protein
MDKPDLRSTLQQLHTELLPIEFVDANDRRKMRQVMADIQELLKQKEGHPPEKLKQLVVRLREGIKMIEVSHPTATGVMDRTINMLARMGI